MEKKFYSLLITLFITSAVIAQTYNTNDIARIKEFMEQTSGGKRNIERLWAGAPATLNADGSNWASNISQYVQWNNDRLQKVEIKGLGVGGKLDLSNCTSLSYVYLNNNSLTEVNFKGCSSLANLYLCINQIAKINLEDCYNIKEMTASSNQYTTIDVSNRKNLTRLYLPNNVKLESVNVKGCTKLSSLTFTKGNVASVDLGDCQSLSKFECYGNKISALDLSKNPKLKTLVITSGTYTNPITSINVSGCKELESYDFSSYSNLQSLNVSNCGLSTINLSKYKKLTSLEAGGQQLSIEEQKAVNNKINVKVLNYAGVIVTPSDNGVEENGIITWSVPGGYGKYSYDFTSALPTGVSGTPFGGTVSVPWYNSNPVSTIEVNNMPYKLYTNNGRLFIQSETPQAVRVYSLTGQLIKQAAAISETSFTLDNGIYIVQLGNKTVRKVIVR